MMLRSFLGFLILLVSGASQALAAPRVVASIKPLHSLVAGVMQGVGAPKLLVEGAGSPHGFSLRPSQMRALVQADLIVYVSYDLETFLHRPLKSVAGDARVIEAVDLPGILLLETRKSGTWERHAHAHGHEHAHKGEHDHAAHATIDPHIWLHPKNAAIIVRQLSRQLGAIDADNADRYQQNADRLLQRIAAQQKTLQHKLAPVQSLSYLVFHDAYQYFEAAFELNAVGSVTLNPERKLSAMRLQQIRSKVKSLQVNAIFTEPQFAPKLVQTVAEGMEVRIGALDPLGASIEAGEEAWFTLMEALANDLVKVLKST